MEIIESFIQNNSSLLFLVFSGLLLVFLFWMIAIQELYNISNQINALAFSGFHKFGLVRFNPFKDVGGDQSFSLAILNGKDNGIVISSLFTREGTRVYSKSISAGEAEKYPLTEEEKEAIKKATQKQKKIIKK